jgi:hypothetical protein
MKTSTFVFSSLSGAGILVSAVRKPTPPAVSPTQDENALHPVGNELTAWFWAIRCGGADKWLAETAQNSGQANVKINIVTQAGETLFSARTVAS